jgi:hypothetical protein
MKVGDLVMYKLKQFGDTQSGWINEVGSGLIVGRAKDNLRVFRGMGRRRWWILTNGGDMLNCCQTYLGVIDESR